MSHDGELLIGALLDRLGKRGARTLLTQLDKWLTAETQSNTNRFERYQIGAIEGPYDRRRQDGTELTFDTQSRRR